MLRKNYKIHFNAHDAVNKTAQVVPSSKFFPDWFKNLPRKSENNIDTIKGCVPFKDAMSLGYTIPLWTDLKVEFELCCNLFDVNGNKINEIPVKYEGSSDQFLGREFVGRIVERVQEIGKSTFFSVQDGFGPFPNMPQEKPFSMHGFEQVGENCPYHKGGNDHAIYKLHSPWEIETPRGWSVYIKPYANDLHTPLRILEGVVDTDLYQGIINFPFIWIGGREKNITLPKGTPIAQIIPFKRGKLDLQIGKIDWDRQRTISWIMRSVLQDGYKRYFWHGRNKNE